jgi:DNA primase
MIKIEEILINLGIDYRNAGQENFKACCVNPDHADTNPSMFIHKETGIIHCFSCGFSGSIFTLLKAFEISGVSALTYLQKFAKEGYTAEEIKTALEQFVINRKGDKQEDTVKYGDIEMPQHRMIEENYYLEKRGVTPEEMREWKMAVVTHGKHIGWVLIPLYQNGVLRSYFLRNTFGSDKLYGEYPRHDLLAGLDLVKDYQAPLYLTEGIFDAIAIRRAGYQAVACLSNRLLKGQLEILKKFKQIVVVPDNDKMGMLLVESASTLIHSCEVFVSALPGHRKDAAECTLTEIKVALQYKQPWNIFLIDRKVFAKIS